jgi:hypothetical protein
MTSFHILTGPWVRPESNFFLVFFQEIFFMITKTRHVLEQALSFGNPGFRNSVFTPQAGILARPFINAVLCTPDLEFKKKKGTRMTRIFWICADQKQS